MIPVRKDIGCYGREWKGSWHPSFPGWFIWKLDITLDIGFSGKVILWQQWLLCCPGIRDNPGLFGFSFLETNGVQYRAWKINPWPSNASSLNLVCCWFLVQFGLYCFGPKVIVLIFLAERPQVKRIGLMSRFLLKITFRGLSQMQALHMMLEGQGWGQLILFTFSVWPTEILFKIN